MKPTSRTLSWAFVIIMLADVYKRQVFVGFYPYISLTDIDFSIMLIPTDHTFDPCI